MSRADYYPLGTAIYLFALVANRFDDPVAPTNISLRLQRPDGTEFTVVVPPMVNEELGRYSHEFVPDANGLWRYRWETTNPQAADEGAFHISASHFA